MGSLAVGWVGKLGLAAGLLVAKAASEAVGWQGGSALVDWGLQHEALAAGWGQQVGAWPFEA